MNNTSAKYVRFNDEKENDALSFIALFVTRFCRKENFIKIIDTVRTRHNMPA
jgi:hypothetical protein